jgi:hypothetical protein
MNKNKRNSMNKNIIEENSKMIDKLIEAKTKLEEELANKQQETNLQQDNDSYQLKSEIETLNKKLSNLEESLSQILSQLSKSEYEKKDLQIQNIDLFSEIDSLKIDNELLSKEKEIMKSTIQEKVTESITSANGVDKEIDSLKIDNELLIYENESEAMLKCSVLLTFTRPFDDARLHRFRDWRYLTSER